MYTSMAAIWDNDLFGSDWFDKTWVSLSLQVNVRKTTKLQRWQRLYARRLEEDNVKSSLPWVRPSPAVSCFLLLGLDSHPAMQKHNKHTLLWQLGTILCCIAIEHNAWNRHFFRCMPIFVRFENFEVFEIKSKNFSTKNKNFKKCTLPLLLSSANTFYNDRQRKAKAKLIGGAINWGEREVH